MNTEVFAVSVDPIEQNRRLAKKHRIEFSILSDPDLTVIDAFGVRHPGGFQGKDIARPAVFIIDTTGKVVSKDLTENYRVRIRPDRLLEQLRRVL